jgi:hypothetical protein
MIPDILYLLRRVILSISMGGAVYTILVFSKPLIENVTNRHHSIDGYYWFIVLTSVIIAIITWMIL